RRLHPSNGCPGRTGRARVEPYCGKGASPRRRRTSGRRSGGTVGGGWRRAGSSASRSAVIAAISLAAACMRSLTAAFGFEMPLTLRTYCKAAASISSRVAGGSRPRSSVMFRHMCARVWRQASADRGDAVIEVRDNQDQERFEVFEDGRLAGFARYIRRAGRLIFVHTEVDQAFEGRGIGSELAAGALD